MENDMIDLNDEIHPDGHIHVGRWLTACIVGLCLAGWLWYPYYQWSQHEPPVEINSRLHYGDMKIVYETGSDSWISFTASGWSAENDDGGL